MPSNNEVTTVGAGDGLAQADRCRLSQTMPRIQLRVRTAELRWGRVFMLDVLDLELITLRPVVYDLWLLFGGGGLGLGLALWGGGGFAGLGGGSLEDEPGYFVAEVGEVAELPAVSPEAVEGGAEDLGVSPLDVDDLVFEGGCECHW